MSMAIILQHIPPFYSAGFNFIAQTIISSCRPPYHCTSHYLVSQAIISLPQTTILSNMPPILKTSHYFIMLIVILRGTSFHCTDHPFFKNATILLQRQSSYQPGRHFVAHTITLSSRPTIS